MKFLAVIRKEMQEVAHDRTMMIVLLVFPVFVMVFMGTSFQSLEINGLPVGISGQLNSSTSEMLLGGLNQSSAFKLIRFDSEAEAMTAFRNGQLRAVILIPDDFEQALARGNGSTIRVVVDNSDLALEQSVLAAMSSVIEASSANITRSYVSGAWAQMEGLNDSASALALDIAASRAEMEETKGTLAGIREDIDAISIDSLEDSINDSEEGVASLRTLIEAQEGSLANMSASNSGLLAESGAFLVNASSALNESIETVNDTHARLGDQLAELNGTVAALESSITGLETIRDNSNDSATVAALNLNIAALESLRDTTEQQMADVGAQRAELEELNETLHDFGAALEGYSAALHSAEAGSANLDEMEAALAQAGVELDSLSGSFGSARNETAKMRALLSGIKDTSSQIEDTLDSALEQTASVDSLIGSLQETVAEQTARDPETIASPLSVEVKPQYSGGSYVDFIMPQIISVSLLLSCMLLGSISLVREKTRFTIIKALMAPGGFGSLVAGKLLSSVILSFGQIILIIIVAMAAYGVRPPQNIPMLVAGGVVSCLVLSSIGILVGFYAKRESAAIQTCLLLAIPMLFLGNIIFSPDLLPQYTQVLQQFLPLSHVTSIFKVVLITDGNPTADMAALLGYFILLAGILAFITISRRDISNYV
ncbi:MAG: ABC transporter permease [Candidatus Micrarchaeota archaeon]